LQPEEQSRVVESSSCFFEVLMKTRLFSRPVLIFVGLGFPREVTSVLDAYQVLTEWPAGSRSPIHAKALESCRAALNGEGTVETARTEFETFARRYGILADKVADLPTASARRAAGEAGTTLRAGRL
jgi:hypothetical protein